MPTCFVIQPFDGGEFDKRYEDILDPAIKGADLEPYRVDRDPSASIPIEYIESEIRSSQICLADITKDNPNVWFELGFANAAGKDVVLICNESREGFPFDIQHRNVIRYKTESTSDFEELKERITKRIKAELAKERNLVSVVSPVSKVEGLSGHELVALVAVGQNMNSLEDYVFPFAIKADMERAGFAKIAFTLAIATLMKKSFVESNSVYDGDGLTMAYRLTNEGFAWLMANQDKLDLKVFPTNSGVVGEEDIAF